MFYRCGQKITMIPIDKFHDEVSNLSTPEDDERVTREANAEWRKLREATDILDEPQFTRHDVLQVTRLSEPQLKNTLDRDLVRLRSDHNPGSGRRRMFTGGDILKIVVAHTMSAIGFPMKWSYLVADDIETRASSRLIGLATEKNYGFITYPMSNGDWARIPIHADLLEPPESPVAYQVVEVDRLIDQVIAKLRALIDDAPLPDFATAEPTIEPSPYSPENDFFRMWAKDDLGRNVRVGLTFEESQELAKLEALSLTEHGRSRDDGERYLELHDRHELARFARMGIEMKK